MMTKLIMTAMTSFLTIDDPVFFGERRTADPDLIAWVMFIVILPSDARNGL